MAGKNQAAVVARSRITDALGYVDRGIGTRAHDEHLHWLESNLDILVPQLCPPAQWDPPVVQRIEHEANEKVSNLRKKAGEDPVVPERIKQILADWTGLGPPPPAHQSWEYVLQSPVYLEDDSQLRKKCKREVLAYFDVEVIVTQGTELRLRSETILGHYFAGFGELNEGFGSHVPTWQVHEARRSLLFLVEPEIEGYGDLMQRIRAYEDHIDGSVQFVVVCPDDTYAASFRRQSIQFVKCPPAKAQVS